MKRILQSFGLMISILMISTTANANYVQLADGVYQDGSTLYICSDVTSLGDLQLNPSEIYCYATIPPACVSNTFTGYDAILHVPAAGMVSYFTTLYWYNFNNILSDAIEPLSVTMNTSEAELEIDQQLSLSATVAPGDAMPKTVYWSSTDASVATVSTGGTVTAVATGECDILATCIDKVAICHLTVVNPCVTVTLDKHKVRLLPNHTITLTVTCSPIDVDLAVTSSTPGVAIPRLVSGSIIVVGVSEGTTSITVNAADGNGNPDSCEVTIYTEHGDLNCDGYVNISDVTKLIDYLLSGNPEGISVNNADTNKDGDVNISDVTTLIDYLLRGYWLWDGPPDGHDWIDLGLPSGTLWATCNVGASSPENYGDYFAWGETSTYKYTYSDWYYYQWSNCPGPGYPPNLTKYCTNNYYGTVDNKTELDPEDDAAYVKWGEKWRMPTQEQLQELIDNCTWTWTTLNEVNGQLVTGPNGNTIFLPASGYRWSQGQWQNGYEGSTGCYWSRTLNSSDPRTAYYIHLTSKKMTNGYNARLNGLSVRPVRVPLN